MHDAFFQVLTSSPSLQDSISEVDDACLMLVLYRLIGVSRSQLIHISICQKTHWRCRNCGSHPRKWGVAAAAAPGLKQTSPNFEDGQKGTLQPCRQSPNLFGGHCSVVSPASALRWVQCHERSWFTKSHTKFNSYQGISGKGALPGRLVH